MNEPRAIVDFTHEMSEADIKEALRKLCNLEYWKRLWVVPEVSLAEDLSFMYGGTTLLAQKLFGLLYAIKVLGAKSEAYFSYELRQRVKDWPSIVEVSAVDAFLRPTDTGSDIWRTALNHRRTFADLCYTYGLKQCADSRDRVFALMAVSSDFQTWQLITMTLLLLYSANSALLTSRRSHLNSPNSCSPCLI